MENPKDLITAHLGADFDCLAAMVAAQKLYPEASLAFPGSQEGAVRAYLQSVKFSFPLLRVKQVDGRNLRRLIVVDTQSRARLGPLGSLLDLPELEVHLYDHHPDAVGDISAHFAVVRPVGATTTILVEILQEREIALSPQEATTLALGIYEDTGALTSVNTTPADLKAAAYLLASGADLAVVDEHLRRKLNPEQVSLLNDLLESAEEVQISGIPIVVATASRDHYVNGLALVAHEFRASQHPLALFFLVQMGDKVQLVARSRVPEVNAGAIATALGGGGHASAASASIKNMTLIQARDRLGCLLHDGAQGDRTVADVMVTSVRSVQAQASIQEVERLMTRYNLNTLPVVGEGEEGAVVGLITRQVLEKAIFHDLGGEPVSAYMSREFETLPPDAPARKALDLLLAGRQKLIPIVSKVSKMVREGQNGGRLEGVIARGDILRYLHEGGEARPEGAEGLGLRTPRTRDVRSLARERLPKETLRILEVVGEIVDTLGFTVYAVGGFVRDLLMGIGNLDLDLVVEGEGIALAERLAAREGGRHKVHKQYGTAVVTLPDGQRVDVATARVEYYERPAALPVVERGSIRADLYRRDFTINALAIQLNGRQAWRLIDLFGGQRDIKEKVVRVIQGLSFVEDPTRAFRAVRFVERYGFAIGAQTGSLLEAAVQKNLFDRLSGKRLFGEFQLILSEPDPWRYVARLGELQLLQFIHPSLKADVRLRERFREVGNTVALHALLFTEEPVEAWFVYFLGLLSDLKEKEVEEICNRLSLTGRRQVRAVEAGQTVQDILAGLMRGDPSPSQVYRLLHPLPAESVLLALALAPSQAVKKKISFFLTKLKNVRPSLRGEDLLEMGVPPGPDLGRLLEATRDALLDGLIEHGEVSERTFVRHRLALHAAN